MKMIFYLPLTILVTACGAGSGIGLDEQGFPITESSIANSAANSSNDVNNSSSSSTGVTLAQLQTEIFGAICIRCHTGSSAPRGLRLDSEDNSYAFLVNQPADEIPTLMRVNPNRPDDSYIIQKLEGNPTIIGSQMPLGGPYLSDAEIQKIRDWIAQGAQKNNAVAISFVAGDNDEQL
jgi:mono/diheme cytochrome c family protein